MPLFLLPYSTRIILLSPQQPFNSAVRRKPLCTFSFERLFVYNLSIIIPIKAVIIGRGFFTLSSEFRLCCAVLCWSGPQKPWKAPPAATLYLSRRAVPYLPLPYSALLSCRYPNSLCAGSRKEFILNCQRAAWALFFQLSEI